MGRIGILNLFIITLFISYPWKTVSANPSYFLNPPNEIRDYLIPDNHPVKYKLDQIFSQSRVFFDFKSMQNAGFSPAVPQHHTEIIVTRHPTLKGYVIKAFLDIQDYHSDKPEYYFWIKRCKGANLIRNAIAKHHFEHIMKVPRKWIYQLPKKPQPASKCIIKNYILVEEDMNIYDDKTNLTIWGSACVTKNHLNALYTILTELKLIDCAKPANCPFAKDGKIAFVDTQSFYKSSVHYHKLNYALSPTNRLYWMQLTSQTSN